MLEHSIDWEFGMQGKNVAVEIDSSVKGKKTVRVMLETPGRWFLTEHWPCAFVYEEPGSEASGATSSRVH